MNNETITVVGLGSMGFGMAQSLLRAGYTVHCVDIDPARAEALTRDGGLATPLGDAVADSDIVVLVVLNAKQIETVLFGPQGCADAMRRGSVIVACATVPPAFAREMEERVNSLGLLYLDAPISGGAVRAARGELSIMASGAQDAFDRAAPALDAMAANLFDLGREAGMGSAMKAVNQLLAGIHIAATGEALAFAASQKLPLSRVVEVISQSAGTSWMFENRAPHVVEADYKPRSAVNIWLKDLGIVTGIAETAGLPLPVTESALAQFSAAVEAGDGQADDAAVVKVYARAAGLKLPGEA
ncbi:L-threonate dehydrogenase [Roseibium salinum]|uniref:L-threonate dehydrogenase n=1 Tax=Roseibium salinum TaxID=1604349 RepID=A0ABT3QW63_9HYPH|nr:L-threonate dehydrogenase [Roseibium sp. DSM 29163]MCX2721147.1 NAD(P)-dependent oxidoreductase [Roseibium sp. DSM 29163]MDN3722613.1 NAD(P)-dependent oxidoreductase [Roseibium salinum]